MSVILTTSLFLKKRLYFFDKNYSTPYDPAESLPEQRRHIGGAFASSVKNITELFREAKGCSRVYAPFHPYGRF